MRIFLLGFMGAGKSYWGKSLSPVLNLPFFDLDDEIVKGEGKNIADIFEHFGETHFRQLENQYLKNISQKKDILLACGGGTPCFSGNMEWMNEKGMTIWLNPSVEVLVERLKPEMNHRPLLKDLTHKQLTEFVTAKLEERKPFYEKARLIINPENYNLHTLPEKIKSCINPI